MDINIKINEYNITFQSQTPLVYEQEIYIPVRDIFEELNYTVVWVSGKGPNPKGTITIYNSKYRIVLIEDNTFFTLNGIKYNYNGNGRTTIIGGKTMVPLYDILEKVDCNVVYDTGTATAIITTTLSQGYTNQQVTDIISNYKKTYNEKYWNAGKRNKELSSTEWGVTTQPCSTNCSSNVFGAAEGYNVPSQCYGFSLFMAYIIFEDYISLNDINNAKDGSTICSNWKYYSKNLTSLTLEPGDIVRTSSHSAMIWKVNATATKVEVAEVWGSVGCKIKFGNFNGSSNDVSASTILKQAVYVLKAPKEGSTPIEPIYKITNVGASKCLNISGDNLTSLTNNMNVTLWDDSGTNEQKWVISSLSDSVYIKSVIDTAFGLNVYRSGNPYNCNILKLEGNGTDSLIDIQTSGNYYKVKLHNYNLYLTVGESTNGTNVYWAESSTSDYQKWSFTKA